MRSESRKRGCAASWGTAGCGGVAVRCAVLRCARRCARRPAPQTSQFALLANPHAGRHGVPSGQAGAYPLAAS
eukprot:7171051-Prymnesium_polylepis.1